MSTCVLRNAHGVRPRHMRLPRSVLLGVCCIAHAAAHGLGRSARAHLGEAQHGREDGGPQR